MTRINLLLGIPHSDTHRHTRHLALPFSILGCSAALMIYAAIRSQQAVSELRHARARLIALRASNSLEQSHSMEARALEAQLTAPGFASSMAAVLHSIPDTIAIRTILFEAPKIEQLDAPAKKTGQNTIAAARMGIRVQLDGFSTHNTAISDALNSLADARIFNHVRLEESRDATLNGVPLHQFQITFDMQQQSSRYAFSGN